MGNKATVQQNDTLVAQAAILAARYHDDQYRTGTQFPYIAHPLGVGFILRDLYPDDPALEAAGYAHDLIEDTAFGVDEMRARLGNDVTDLVLGVTNNGNWRLADYADNPRILRLKAADTLDNVLDTIRGLEKGHDVWSRFRAGRRKAETWRKHTNLILERLPGEPLALRLNEAVTKVETL